MSLPVEKSAVALNDTNSGFLWFFSEFFLFETGLPAGSHAKAH